MKNILVISALIFFTMSCNMNPSKETRITHLETEIQVVTDKVTKLESNVEQLETKIDSLTKQLIDK